MSVILAKVLQEYTPRYDHNSSHCSLLLHRLIHITAVFFFTMIDYIQLVMRANFHFERDK